MYIIWAKASDFNLCKIVGPWMPLLGFMAYGLMAIIRVIEASILGGCSLLLLDVFVIACGIHTAFSTPMGNIW